MFFSIDQDGCPLVLLKIAHFTIKVLKKRVCSAFYEKPEITLILESTFLILLKYKGLLI